VEVQGSIETSCLASGKTFGCKSGWLMFLPVKDDTASTRQMALFIANVDFAPYLNGSVFDCLQGFLVSEAFK